MGQAFDILKQALGSILSFSYDLLDGFMSEGMAYGFSIVLLTVFINLVVFPLTLKQTRATRAFTVIQPEIKKLQKDYKDDPQEMQRRLMELQKSAGATPGGCLLPLLVQMPIWFALFRVLRTPLELDPNTGALIQGATHAINPISALGQALLDNTSKTFFGMDLGMSPADALAIGVAVAIPYLIMMALMVATQYVQQWHSTYGQATPQQGQGGAQQALTKIMPLFIGFISYNFPAGLVVYWATSNLFRLGQQALIFKIDGRPTPPDTGNGKGPDHPPPKSGQGKDGGESDQEPPKKPQPGAANRRRRRRRR